MHTIYEKSVGHIFAYRNVAVCYINQHWNKNQRSQDSVQDIYQIDNLRIVSNTVWKEPATYSIQCDMKYANN